jgi:TPR repeat protein
MPIILAILMLASPTFAELQKSCETGDAAACDVLGNRLRDGLGVQRDLPRAAQLFRMACERKSPDGCADDAHLLALGEGQDAKPRAALPRLEKMCKAGQARACGHLGDVFARGRGAPQDVARAEDLLAKACKQGDARSCTNLAPVAARSGSSERARELAGRGCDLGDVPGCAYLGELYAKSQDTVRAGLYFSRACEAGMPHGCTRQGYLLFESGVDPRRGRELLQKGCDGGDADACEVLRGLK